MDYEYEFSPRRTLSDTPFPLHLLCAWFDGRISFATPRQTEGPFIQTNCHDTDNDLIILITLTPAVCTVAYLTGVVTDIKETSKYTCRDLQVDNNGVYLHSRGGSVLSLTQTSKDMDASTDSKVNIFSARSN